MADTTIIRNNASVDLPSHAPPPPPSSHTFLTVDRLTHSPTSSTGSASVLDWNSNSDGEMLEWPFSAPPTPPTLTAPSSPHVPSSSNTLDASVEPNGDHSVPSRPSLDSSEPGNVPEPCHSPQLPDLSTLSERFHLFNLMGDVQNTIFNDPTGPSAVALPQFSFNFVDDNFFSNEPKATPSQDAADVDAHDDDIYGPPAPEDVLRPQSSPPFPNTPAATADTSMSSTSTCTVLAAGGDSSATSMTTVTPAASPAVASSLFLPPRTNSNSSSADGENTQGICSLPTIPFITPNPSPTISLGQRSYATSEASTDRNEYQSRSPSPHPNNLSRGAFGYHSWIPARETMPSIQHSPVSAYTGWFGSRPLSQSSRTTSPVPEISVEERTSGPHSNAIPLLPTPTRGLSGYSESNVSVSSVEIGRRGEPQIDIPSWLRAAPHSTIPKVEIATAIQDSDSIRLEYPYGNPFPVPPVGQPASTNRRWDGRQRARPPLPPLPPHAQVTPQFALRSHSPNSDVGTNNYFAAAVPSRWNVCTLASPRPRPVSPGSTSVSDSPWPAAQPLSPGPYPTSWQRRTLNPLPASGWGCFPPPRPPHQNTFGANFSRNSVMTPSTWGTFSSNTRAQTSGPVLSPSYSPIPGPATPCLNPWGTPPQRRLRFAPLPSTPGSNANNAPRNQPQPPILPLPQVPPPSYNFQPQASVPYGTRPGYLYSTPAPVIPLPTSQMDLYTPSSRFWFTDGTVIFRVENTLHKVHRHFFELHSEHFKKLLSTYWFSPTSHLFLPEIKKTEFEKLLSIFYPMDLAKPDISNVEGWTSILALSNKYVMPQLESLSVQKLHALTTPVEKIALAKKFDLGKKHHQNWLIPAYVDLCSRDAPLSLEEAEQLDMPTVIMVWNVRHAVKVVMSRGRRGVVAQEEVVLRLVKESWGLGQEDVDEEDEEGFADEDAVRWSDFQYTCR